jgi:hypothetical protein
MSDLSPSCRQAHQKLAAAAAQPVEDGTGGSGRDECFRQRDELGDKLEVLAAEKIVHSVASDAPSAAPVGVNVARVVAASAGRVDVNAPAGPACLAASFGRSHQHASGAAECAGGRLAASPSVARRAERARRPGRQDAVPAAAVPALVQGEGPASVAVEGTVRPPDVLAPAESAADSTNAFDDAAVRAEPGVAVLAALGNSAKLTAPPALKFRGPVAAFADGPFSLEVGMRGPGGTTSDTLVIRSSDAGGAHQDRGSIPPSLGVVAVPPTPRAGTGELFLLAVAAAADHAFWSADDHPPALAAACAPFRRVSLEAVDAAASLRGQALELAGEPATDGTTELGDAVAVAEGSQMPQQAGQGQMQFIPFLYFSQPRTPGSYRPSSRL